MTPLGSLCIVIFLITATYAYPQSSSSELAADGKDCSRCYECFACQNGGNACTPIPGCIAYCSSDAVCANYQSCIDGVCQKITVTEAPDDHTCSKNTDCPDALTCYDEECRRDAGPGNMCGGRQADEPCFECFECNEKETRCVPIAGCYKSMCNHDAECERSQVCLDGECTLKDRNPSSSRDKSKSRDHGVCYSDDDCGGKKTCYEGECALPTESVSGKCVWEGEVLGKDPCGRLSMEECLTGGPMGSCIWEYSDSMQSVLYQVEVFKEMARQWDIDLYIAGAIVLVIIGLFAWRYLRKRNRKDRIATARAQAQTEMPRTAGMYYQQL